MHNQFKTGYTGIMQFAFHCSFFRLLFILMIILSPGISTALADSTDELENALQRAEKLVKENKNEEALQIYHKNMTRFFAYEENHADFLFNFAVTAWRANQPQLAYALIKRARLLAPFDTDIKANHALITAQTANASELARPYRENWFNTINIFTWFSLTLAFGCLALLLIVFGQIRSAGFFTSISLSVMFAAASVYFTVNLPLKHAVVHADTIDVRSGPGSNFADFHKLVRGSVVAVVETRDDWSKVTFVRNGRHSGWVQSEALLNFYETRGAK